MIKVIKDVECDFIPNSNVVMVGGNKFYLHSVVWDKIEDKHIAEVEEYLSNTMVKEERVIKSKKLKKSKGGVNNG